MRWLGGQGQSPQGQCAASASAQPRHAACLAANLPSLLALPQVRVIRQAAEAVFKAAGATVEYKVRKTGQLASRALPPGAANSERTRLPRLGGPSGAVAGAPACASTNPPTCSCRRLPPRR